MNEVGCLYQSKVGEGQGEANGCYMYCSCLCRACLGQPRTQAFLTQIFLAGLEKNRGVRPGSISHVMRAADVTAIIL